LAEHYPDHIRKKLEPATTAATKKPAKAKKRTRKTAQAQAAHIEKPS
jgi:hypothetical protein